MIKAHRLWRWTRVGFTDPGRNEIGSPSSESPEGRVKRESPSCTIGIVYRTFVGIASITW